MSKTDDPVEATVIDVADMSLSSFLSGQDTALARAVGNVIARASKANDEETDEYGIAGFSNVI